MKDSTDSICFRYKVVQIIMDCHLLLNIYGANNLIGKFFSTLDMNANEGK